MRASWSGIANGLPLLAAGSIMAGGASAPGQAQAPAPVTSPTLSAGQAPVALDQGQAAANPAADDGGRLDDIVVTAQRRSENLQNVPISVTAIDAVQLAASGVTDTSDLQQVTPSLSFTNGVGNALPRIRGIGTSATGAGIENPVAIYIDGVYIASASSALTSLNNIQQVAVLKGPQGTLFGRNATGGLIQITTRTPSHTFGGDVGIGYGNRDTLSGNLYVTGGLGAAVAADLAVYYNDQRDGFGTNIFNGQDVGNARDIALRSKFLVEIGASTNATIALDYADRDANLPAFRPVYGSLPITGLAYTGGAFDVNSNVQPSLKTRQGGAALTIEHDFEAVKLTSITAYRRSTYDSVFDGDKLPQALARTAISQDDNQFSQELQLASGRGSRLQWVIGAFYFDATGKFDPLQVSLPTGISTVRGTQKTDSIAAYGQATYPVLPDTNVTVGLRYTSEKRSLDGLNQFTTATGIALPATSDSDAKRYRRLTWRFALDHHFGERLLGYLSYNRGFKSGGYNPQSLPAVPFDPEVLDAYEGGFKADLFSRTVRLNGAIFYYDYKNIQVTAFRNQLSAIYNAASAKIYGLDADLTIAPVDNLTLTLGGSLLHDRFGTFNTAVISTPRPTGGNIIGTGSATGNRLPLTPDWTLNTSVDYVVPLPTGSIRLNVSYLHNDGFYAEPDNRLRQGAYDVINASGTWFIDTDSRMSVRVWGKNLTNKAYAVQINAQANSDGVIVAPGRTFGGTLAYKF